MKRVRGIGGIFFMQARGIGFGPAVELA